jgi:GT2 family glycosyltransferase
VVDVPLALDLLAAVVVREERRDVERNVNAVVLREQRELARAAVGDVEPATKAVPPPQREPRADEVEELEKRPRGSVRFAAPSPKSTPLLTAFFSTVSCVVKRSVYKYESFSSAIVMSEDQEWSGRMVKRGYRVAYAPKSEVYHSHNYPLAQALRRFFDAGMTARMSYLKRNPGNWSSLARHALRYPLHELHFLVKTGHAAWIPYALVYEAAKCSGWKRR